MRTLVNVVMIAIIVACCIALSNAADVMKPAPLTCTQLTVRDDRGNPLINIGPWGIQMLDENGKKAIEIKAHATQKCIEVFSDEGKTLMKFEFINKLSIVDVRSVGNKAAVVLVVDDKSVTMRGQVEGGPVQTVLPVQRGK